jgi:hypothetical protein
MDDGNPEEIRWIIYDWDGIWEYFKSRNGVYYVDPKYEQKFKKEHRVL